MKSTDESLNFSIESQLSLSRFLCFCAYAFALAAPLSIK